MSVLKTRTLLLLAGIAVYTLRSSAGGLQQQPVQRAAGKGAIEVHVIRQATSDGIRGVNLTLQMNPTSEQIAELFTPSSSLTAPQRQQVDQIIEEGIRAGGATAETVAGAARSLQARLLGQQIPTQLLQIARSQDTKLQTDSDGRYTFTGLRPGQYRISAESEGYFGAGTVDPSQPSAVVTKTIAIKEGDDLPVAVTLPLIRGAVLGGIVRDPGGKPAPETRVGVYRTVYSNGRQQFGTVNETATDDRGEFRVFWLPPGDYYIAALPPRPELSASSRNSWSKTYFPGTTDPRAAAAITVVDGLEMNAINITLRAETKAKISGTIVNPFVDDKGKPTVPTSTIYLLPRNAETSPDSPALNFQNVATNRQSGQFEIRNVPPGSYDLLANAPTGTSSPAAYDIPIINLADLIAAGLIDNRSGLAWGRTRIDVGSEDFKDVVVNLKPANVVRIRVGLDGAPPPYTVSTAARGNIAGPQVQGNSAVEAAAQRGGTGQPVPRIRVSLQSLESGPFSGGSSSYDASGVFTFPSVPESRYRVQVSQLPTDAYVEDIRLGSASISDSGFTVDGPLPGDIEVLVSSKGGQVQGTVRTRDDKPFSGARVVLVPAPIHRGNPALYKTARTSEAGTFTFKGVAPGEYKIFAWENVLNDAWTNAAFLARYEPLGLAITVTAGGSTADLRLIPADYGR